MQSCLVFNLPKCIKAIFIAWSVIPASRSAFTMVDHFGTSRFIHSISISCLHLLVVTRSRCMVLRTDTGTLRDKPSWNQSVTSCSSLTSSFKLTLPAESQVTKQLVKNYWGEYDIFINTVVWYWWSSFCTCALYLIVLLCTNIAVALSWVYLAWHLLSYNHCAFKHTSEKELRDTWHQRHT